MKKLLCVLLSVSMLFALCACGAADSVSAPAESEATAPAVDVDLTALSSTMVYSEVYNMVSSPDSYLGKTVKMAGSFAVYQDEASGKRYYACIISDATACCSQGLEFVLKDARSYPEGYPALSTEITVTGTFDTYKEGEYTYYQLINAELAY